MLPPAQCLGLCHCTRMKKINTYIYIRDSWAVWLYGMLAIKALTGSQTNFIRKYLLGFVSSDKYCYFFVHIQSAIFQPIIFYLTRLTFTSTLYRFFCHFLSPNFTAEWRIRADISAAWNLYIFQNGWSNLIHNNSKQQKVPWYYMLVVCGMYRC